MKVFVIEKLVGKEIAPDVKRFGEVIFIFDGTFKRPALFNTDGYMDMIKTRLLQLGFDPSIDCVLPFGSLLSNVQLFSVLASIYKRYQVLFFNSPDSSFVMREFHNGKCKSVEQNKKESTKPNVDGPITTSAIE